MLVCLLLLSICASVMLGVALALFVGVAHPEWLPGGGAAWAGGTLNIRTTGRPPPIVTYQGVRAYQFTYAAGKIHGEGVNGSITLFPAVLPADRVRVRYRVWFADNFGWDGEGGRSVGGKLGGLMIGTGDSTGGNFSTTGASYRVVFKRGGEANGYLYPELKQAYSGSSVSWDQLDQSDELKSVSKIETGVHVWRGGPLKLYKRRWNTVDMWCKLNTPGAKDGVLALTINGVTRQLDTVRYRNDSARIERFDLGTFFGGGDLSYAPRETTSAWFADFLFTAG